MSAKVSTTDAGKKCPQQMQEKVSTTDARKKVSTTDAILQSTEYVRTEMDKKNTVCGAFLDLSKAFDSISHEILIEKH